MTTKPSPESADLPPLLRHLRHVRIGLQELSLIVWLVLALLARFGLKHWP